MPRGIHKLSARKVETVSGPGWHSDGGGLYLRVDKAGCKRWVFAWQRDKRRREMGLGRVDDVSLLSARQEAALARAKLLKGVDPIDERRVTRGGHAPENPGAQSQPEPMSVGSAPSFGKFADGYIDTHEVGWKNPKHRDQWRATIKSYAFPLHDMPVDEITTDDVVAVLRPIWQRIPETAGRLRSRIENILDAARASKYIAGPWENPARWKGNLVHLLPRRRKKSQVRHHPAVPYEELPALFAQLRRKYFLAARALTLTILCATRTNETLRMKWSEVDFNAEVWTIPAERMKMDVEHRIPLGPVALEILRWQGRGTNMRPNSYVFPGAKRGSPPSQMIMLMLLRRMTKSRYTVHGMRSSFRDYIGDMTDHAESIVEQALAHQVGDATTRAYRRGDAFLKRRKLMLDWEGYLTGNASAPSRS